MIQESSLAPCQFQQSALQALLWLQLSGLSIAGTSCRHPEVACSRSGRHRTQEALQMCISAGLAAAYTS